MLKKLEKSKFISSYWQDSDIGGKRHYYKLTENGKLQVSTLPSYDFLLKSALDEEVDEFEMTSLNSNIVIKDNVEEKPISIMDELLNQNIKTPLETVLPTEEVFAEKTIDVSTEIEQNLSNIDMLKSENVTVEENFATNEDVATFTSKIAQNAVTIPPKKHEQTKFDILNKEISTPNNNIEIEYVDYTDFKNSKENLYAKNLVRKKLFQILATCGCLMLILALCEIVTLFTSRSALYYFFFIGSVLILIFYPVIYLINMDKLRLKYQKTTYKPKTKQQITIGIAITLFILITSIIVSISIGKNSIGSLLSHKNFANLYAPILIFTTYFFNILFNHLIVLKSIKSE